MAAPLLQLHEVTKSFGAVNALRGVTFELQAGEVHALVGENGAGKSTLIKVITGAHQPDAGTLRMNGRVVTHLSPAAAHQAGVAAIYQQPALFPDLTVAENIALSLEPPRIARRVRWRKHRQRAGELLARVAAQIDPETEVRELSMPEQQLVEIARALGAGARILIMDEPTASLTSKEVGLLHGLIRELRGQGVGIIYISHRLPEVFQVADRVTVLRDGQSVGTRSLTTGGGPGSESVVNEAELIRMMVGREVSTLYPPAGKGPHGPLLSLQGVGCRAGGIRDVSFKLGAGEILGLAGLVGAGRTELARILFGLTPADSGTIQLGGKQIQIRSPIEAVQAGIAYVPEDRRRHGVILDMDVAANVTLAVHAKLFPRSWLRLAVERTVAGKYIRELEIKAPSPGTLAGELSGGNQQKVALARWLASEPKLLILDEPTQGVDVGAKAEIHKLIRRLAEAGLGVLMISSDLPEILGMSDRIVVMRGGTVAAAWEGRQTDADMVMAAALGN